MRQGGQTGSKPAVFCTARLAVCFACVAFIPVAVVSAIPAGAVSFPAGSAALTAPAAMAAQEDTEDNTMFWSTTLKMIRAKFPEVVQLSTDSLQTWLDGPGLAHSGQVQAGQPQPERPQAQRPLLLDVREKEEFEVSHLEGAVRAASGKEALEALEGVPPDRPVVLYCSVGYRSSELADFLQKRGYDRVYNLEGSIFAWANEGRPVYRGDERVQVVHPYDQVWGKLLKKALRSR